jgi:hypothetical protein
MGAKIDRLGHVRDARDDVGRPPSTPPPPRRARKPPPAEREPTKALALPPRDGPEWVTTLEGEVLRAASNLHQAETDLDAAERSRKEAADAVRWAKVALKAASTELASARRRAEAQPQTG